MIATITCAMQERAPESGLAEDLHRHSRVRRASACGTYQSLTQQSGNARRIAASPLGVRLPPREQRRRGRRRSRPRARAARDRRRSTTSRPGPARSGTRSARPCGAGAAGSRPRAARPRRRARTPADPTAGPRRRSAGQPGHRPPRGTAARSASGLEQPVVDLDPGDRAVGRIGRGIPPVRHCASAGTSRSRAPDAVPRSRRRRRGRAGARPDRDRRIRAGGSGRGDADECAVATRSRRRPTASATRRTRRGPRSAMRRPRRSSWAVRRVRSERRIAARVPSSTLDINV